MRGNSIAIATLLAIAPAPLLAQAPMAPASAEFEARMELAREIAQLAHAEEQLDLAFERLREGAVSNMLAQLMQVSPARDIGAEVESRYPGGQAGFEREFSRRYAERFRTHYPEILEEIAQYWAQNMSLEELQTTATFFRTDLGSAWVRLLPGTYENMTALGRQHSLQAGIAVAGEMMSAFDSSLNAEAGEETEGAE
ncbi:MAG: DUF2059 domain-containing protein [Pseudomonadota bacterium]